MKPARAVLAILFFLALFGCPGGTRESRSEALLRVQTANVKLGDVISAVVSARTVEQTAARFPETIECSEGLEVFRSASLGVRRLEDGRTEQLMRYEIQCWRTGNAYIGPVKIDVGAGGSIESRPPFAALEAPRTEFLVRSVLEEAVATDIRDIKGPAKLTQSLSMPLQLTAMGLIALLGALFYLVLRRRPRAEPKPAAGFIDPWETALRAFDEMEKEDLAARGDEGIFYIRLTDIMRRYIQGRFGPRATQMTSEELAAMLEMLEEIDPSGRALLRELLKRADQVKFARGSGRCEEKVEFLARAREFVAQTIRRDVAPAGVRR